MEGNLTPPAAPAEAPAPKARVNVINPYGEPENIDPSELTQALKVGYKPMSPEQVQAIQDQQTYGQGLGNMAGAFGAGAARGATFGLSDQALTHSGLVSPETLAKQKQYNPASAITGEIAGVGAGLLAPELEGAGALLNPVRMVTEAGGALGTAATHALVNPETAGLASKILASGVGHGMGSAIEGAVYGLGQSVSEEALGDPDLNGEKVLSNIGYSALFGGALGAAFGGLRAGIAKEGQSAIEGISDGKRTGQATAGEGKTSVRETLDPGASRGAGGIDREAAVARSIQENPKALENLPASSPGPSHEIRGLSESYAESQGLPVQRQHEYVQADPNRGARIAAAYEAMEHNPNDPAVKAAYQALIDETIAQYRAIEGKFKFERIDPGMENPYPDGPRQVLEDLKKGHLWYFPTDSGFGSGADTLNHPLLQPTDIEIDGKKLLANDVFRIVHDVFGHGKEGVGFGPIGEENAWQAHVRMYSPEAARAMTTETRGQNSWVNYGPHGESNRLNPVATTYADQKAGLLPDWVMKEGLAANRAGPSTGYFSQVIQGSAIPSGEKKAILDGLSAMKPDAKEIRDAAGKIGAPIEPYMLSGSRVVERAVDSLANGAPTLSALKVQTALNQGYHAASTAAESTLGDAANLSKAEVGDLLQQKIASRFEGELAPTQQLYKEIEPYSQAIPITDRSTGSISRNIRNIIEEKGLIKGTDNYNFVTTIADGLDQVDNLQKLKNFRTAMSDAVPMKGKHIASLVREKLDNLEGNAIKRYAETMKTSVAKDRILGLIDQISEAKAGYKAWMEKAGELGDVLGKRKIYGPQDFLDFIKEMTPEKFNDKLFAKNNSRFMDAFSKQFPEEMELMKKYKLSEMQLKAMKGGAFDPKALFSEVDKLSPELKNILFKPDQIDKLEAARTYLNRAMPKNFNPSGTSHAEAMRHFFSQGITGTVLSNARDFAMKKFIDHTVKFDPAAGQNISHLVKLERMASDASQKITSGAKSVFKAGGAVAIPAAALSAKAFEKKRDDLSSLAANPEGMLNKMDEHTRNLYQVAPNTAGSVQQATIRATGFLNSKLPQMPAQKPFSPKYQPSKAEISKFSRYHAIVEDPMRALDQVKSGMLLPETVETLSTVYPKLYAEMKSSIMEELTNHLAKKKNLPYQTRLALSHFLGQPLDNASEPMAMAMTQATLSKLGQGPEDPGAPGGEKFRPGVKLAMSTQSQTPLQALSQGNEA